MIKDNWLKNIIVSLIFIVPIVPLIVANDLYFPFITGKAFYFRIISEIVFFLWLVLCVYDFRYRPHWNKLTILVTTFTAIVLLADLLAPNSTKAIWSNFERMEGFMMIFHLWMYYLVISSVFKKENIWSWWMRSTLIVSLVVSFHGLLQLLGKAEVHQGATRIDANLGNSAYLGVYALIHAFLAIYLLFRYFDKTHHEREYIFWPWFYGIMAVSNIVIVYFTSTRGSLLGLLIGLIVASLFILFKEKGFTINKKVSVGILALIFILIAGFVAIKDTNFVRKNLVLSRFADISIYDTKTQARAFIWPMAWKGFLERPIFGFGQEGFVNVFNKHYDPRMYAHEQWFDRAHNVFLDWLNAGGILAFISYLGLYILFIFYVNKNKDITVRNKAVLFGLLSAYAVHNVFVFDNITSYILFFSLLAFVSSQFTEGRNDKNYIKIFDNTPLRNTSLALIVLAFGLSLYFLNIIPLKINTKLIASLSPQKGGIVDNIKSFREALDYNNPTGKQEVREQILSLSTSVLRSSSDDSTKQDMLNLVIRAFDEQIKESPNDARIYYISGRALSQSGLLGDGRFLLTKANALSPNKQTIAFDLISANLAIGSTTEALSLAEKTYESEPGVIDSQVMYGISLIYNKKPNDLQKLLDKHPDIIKDERFAKFIVGK